MLAADREDKIDALVLMATSGTTGADLILEQQLHELERLKVPESEKAQKIALQKQIQAAVVSGTGWDALPEQLRKQADTPWFRTIASGHNALDRRPATPARRNASRPARR